MLDIIDGLRVPSIVVAHTVLKDPTPHQRSVLEAIAAMADQVVVMSEAARQRLCAGFDVDRRKVTTIPHGAAVPDGRRAKRPGRPTLLTWGLLGPGKGIERVIDAMTSLQRPARSAAVPGRRPDAPEGLGRRRRGIPRRPHRPGAPQRRGGFGVLRRQLLGRVVVDRADPVRLGRRAALRLHRSGHLGCSGRRDRRRQARGGHRVSARRRAARPAERASSSTTTIPTPWRRAAPGADRAAPRRRDGRRRPADWRPRWRGRWWRARIWISRDRLLDDTAGDWCDDGDCASRLRPSAAADRPSRHLRARLLRRAPARARLLHRRHGPRSRRRHPRTRRRAAGERSRRACGAVLERGAGLQRRMPQSDGPARAVGRTSRPRTTTGADASGGSARPPPTATSAWFASWRSSSSSAPRRRGRHRRGRWRSPRWEPPSFSPSNPSIPRHASSSPTMPRRSPRLLATARGRGPSRGWPTRTPCFPRR